MKRLANALLEPACLMRRWFMLDMGKMFVVFHALRRFVSRAEAHLSYAIFTRLKTNLKNRNTMNEKPP